MRRLVLILILIIAVSVAVRANTFDQELQFLRHNFNFIDSAEYPLFNSNYDEYYTIIFNDEFGIAFLIEHKSIIRVSVFSQAGNIAATERGKGLRAADFLPNGQFNLVAIGLGDGYRIVSTF